MTLYRNCTVETFFASETASWIGECDVRLDDAQIMVEYVGEHGLERYVGYPIGEGHFELKCPEVKGSATLHQSADGQYLEGYWRQEGYYGMWRIQIMDDA